MSRFWSSIVHDLTPYVPGEQPKLDNLVKLNTNENPYPPSPHVLAAIASATDRLRLYPDPQGRALCSRLAADFVVDERQIVLGNGSEDLIAVICRSVVRPGDAVATLYPSFPLHEDYTTLMGGIVERVTVTPDLDIDLDALLAAIARRPRMLMFSNPMNPVGAWLEPDALARVFAAVDPETLVVVEAVAGAAPIYKRMQPKARGQGGHILKRGCNVRIVVSDGDEGDGKDGN